MKTKKEFKPFSEIKFSGESVLYDATVDQTVPFPTTQKAANGMFETYLAHILAPVTGARYIKRAEDQAENERLSLDTNEPSLQLWSDSVKNRIGYVAKDNWKDTTPFEHKTQAITRLMQIDLIVDLQEVSDSDFLFDDEENCLRFKVSYGGVSLDTWREWLTSGKMPANLSEWFDQTEYEKAIRLINKNIPPMVFLEVKHYFKQPTQSQRDEFVLIQEKKPRKGVLASAAKVNQLTFTERLIELHRAVEYKFEGYKSEVPAWHRQYAAGSYLNLVFADVGKSADWSASI